ncbi:MAG: hypothetical protein LQ346_006902 [Caloplaca aetnensis]|nr:MAG: hypothetical protein LQ346_006902 [Caloplaca aetnensis]
MAPDPLDSLFELENTFYEEGHDLGVQDGSRAGRIEGRRFGLEKGFEKYVVMGRLHGRSVVWAGRLSSPSQTSSNLGAEDTVGVSEDGAPGQASHPPESTGPDAKATIPHSTRLEKHIRTLYALTEPASLSTDNTEEAVSDFDDRLRRAEGKVKIIEKAVGDASLGGDSSTASSGNAGQSSSKVDGGIEDMSVLQARH